MVHSPESNTYRGAERRFGVPALDLRALPMATYPVIQESREVVRCTNPKCKLMQYWTINSLCRRCRKPLRVEEPVRPGPVAVEGRLVEASAEAGQQVADQVREIRRQRHLSQRQLAGRMQVPRTYISKIENGKAIPTLGSLERLAAALGVEMCKLVRDARSSRDEEVASVLSDPLLAEIAALLPRMSSLHRALVHEAARDMFNGRQRTA